MANRMVRWLACGLVLLGISLPGSAPAQAMAEDGGKVDLSYVTPEAFAAAIVHPRRVLTAPEMQMMPIEVLSAAGKKELGLDPLDVEQAVLFVEPPAQGPPGYGIVLHLAKAHDLSNFIFPSNVPLTKSQLEGRTYQQSRIPFLPSFYMPDDQTLIMATDAVLKRMLANHKTPVKGPLTQLMTKTSVSADAVLVAVLEPVRPMLNGVLAQAPLPPQLADLKQLPKLIDAAKFDLSITGSPQASFVVLSPDEATARQLEQLINQMLDLGRQMAMASIATEMNGDDPVQQASAQYAKRMLDNMITLVRPHREGRKLKVSQQGNVAGQTATVGVLVALLLPAVQSAREAARRMQSVNNLKQIALAMHNYHDTYKKFPPPANFNAAGKPLLSWRVHILPFIDQQQLYKQFHLDEPWDSPNNKPLIDQMPPIYRNPSSPAPANRAAYLVPIGTGSIFANPKGTSIRQITDGTSNTIMVVEVDPNSSVIWTKPRDLAYNPQRPLQGLGKAHPGGFNVALADGSVRFISNNVDPRVFLQMLNMADGQPRMLPTR